MTLRFYDTTTLHAHVRSRRQAWHAVQTVRANLEAMLRNMDTDGHAMDTPPNPVIDSGRVARA